MTSYRIERASDPQDLARSAAEHIGAAIDLALDQRDRAQIALSGGSTPALAYDLLGQAHLPWDRVDVFLGDERWVAADDESSNARMLRNTLLKAGHPGSRACFHPVPTMELPTAEASAEAFASLATKICAGNPPVFDLMLLGLGDDGHTACNDRLWVHFPNSGFGYSMACGRDVRPVLLYRLVDQEVRCLSSDACRDFLLPADDRLFGHID